MLGALSIYASEPDAFTEPEIALLQEMAEDLAFGIASIRARAERERLLARLSALHELDRGILRATDPRDLALRALEGLRRLVRCDRAGVALVDPASGLATVFAAVGEEPLGLPERATFPVSEAPWFEAAERERVAVIPDLREVRSTELVADLVERGVRSVLAAVLRAEGEHLGAVVLSSGVPNGFDAEAREITGEVADQLAVALRHARLREQVERHAAELERRVAERTAELSERNGQLEAFSAAVAHDLRAPLRAIAGFGRALLEGARLEAGARGDAERIVAAGARLDRLIDDLLAYSRLSLAELPLRPVRLDEVVTAALEEVAADVDGTGAGIEVVGPLPSVLGHRSTLVRVVANLLGNAVKFMAPGTRPLVRVSAEVRGRRVRLSVADNGIGVPPEHRERIFQPLERIHGRDAYPGTGIGLAIVRTGIERMGGRVGVEGRPEGGSIFWMELESGGGPADGGGDEGTPAAGVEDA